MYCMYIQKVLFPITPGKMTIKTHNMNKTITLINESEVNLIKTPGLSEITIDELLLPAFQNYPFAQYGILRDENGKKLAGNNKDQHADYYIDKLEAWKKKKKPVTFVLSRTSPDGTHLLWDTNFDVTIEDYEIIEDADKYGMDICVKLIMKEYRTWGAKKVIKEKNGKNKTNSSKNKTKATVKKTRKTKEKAKSYVVKSGDCLINIAKKQLNDSSKWTKIYNLNKSVIEATAKKHGRKSSSNGHWIYPGTKLKLPN